VESLGPHANHQTRKILREQIIQTCDGSYSCVDMKIFLNRQRFDGEMCDVILVVEEKKFNAHRCVLATASAYFRTMFKTEVRCFPEWLAFHGKLYFHISLLCSILNY